MFKHQMSSIDLNKCLLSSRQSKLGQSNVSAYQDGTDHRRTQLWLHLLGNISDDGFGSCLED